MKYRKVKKKYLVTYEKGKELNKNFHLISLTRFP